MKDKYTTITNIHLHNLGLGEFEEHGISVGGAGSKAGLYGANAETRTVSTTSLERFCDDRDINKVFYAVIDVEGYEPKVIRGMYLEKESNQRRFSQFQFELGNAWLENDERRMNDKWGIRETVTHLETYGYSLFMIGSHEWIQVSSDFFVDDVGLRDDEGKGKFVQGNLLAIHPRYGHKSFYDIVRTSSEEVYKIIQSGNYKILG